MRDLAAAAGRTSRWLCTSLWATTPIPVVGLSGHGGSVLDFVSTTEVVFQKKKKIVWGDCNKALVRCESVSATEALFQKKTKTVRGHCNKALIA